jgi:methyl-accepting chemotaxis protein
MISNLVATAVQLSEKGKSLIKVFVTQMGAIEENIITLEDSIANLGKRSQQIGLILETII